MVKNSRSMKRPRPYRKRSSNNRALLQVEQQTQQMELQQMIRPMPSLPDFKMIPPKYKNKPFSVWSSVSRGAITTSTTLPSAGAITFILSDLTDASSYAAIFDEFRLIAVRVDFIIGGATNPLTGPPGLMQTALDYNDAIAPTSVNDLPQYESYQCVPVGQFFQRTVRPKISLPAYTGTLFNGFVPKKDQWIETNSPSTVHYGIKYYIPAIPVSVYTIQPMAHYHFQFRMIH